MSIRFLSLVKHVPWVVEALLPALVVALTVLIAVNTGADGILTGIVFIAVFLGIFFHNRRVMLRKLFASTLAIIWGPNLILAPLKSLTDHGWLITVIESILNQINTIPDWIKVCLMVFTGLLAVAELVFIDSFLADKALSGRKKGLRIIPIEQNMEDAWYFRYGKERIHDDEDNLVEVISFCSKLSVALADGDKDCYLQDVLGNVQLESQFWRTLPVRNKYVEFDGQWFELARLPEVKFAPGSGPKEMIISWEVLRSKLPWYVNYFNFNSLSLSFQIKDSSGNNHYIAGTFERKNAN